VIFFFFPTVFAFNFKVFPTKTVALLPVAVLIYAFLAAFAFVGMIMQETASNISIVIIFFFMFLILLK